MDRLGTRQLNRATLARQLLLRHPPFRVPVNDAGVVRDLDTPADLAQETPQDVASGQAGMPDRDPAIR